MGANAQTSVPTFTAGEVLTAANMNISARTGIPVFATTTTRDAAFGGTGEKTLAEGQFAYIEATNATQYYDGAAWQSVGASSGLVCVKAETSFSAVSSFSFDDVFTSTYTNYLMTIIYTSSTTANIDIKMRVGGVAASTNYNRNRGYFQSTVAGSEQDTAQTQGRLLVHSASGQGAGTIQIFQPFVAAATVITSQHSASAALYNEVANITHTTATAYDGMQFTPSSGTITGSYAIYGYSKAV
jgi:hypothetical protein